MTLKTRTKVQPFTSGQEKSYLKRKDISEEMSRIEKRLRDLKSDRKKIDAKLAPAFEQFDNRRKLSDGTIVNRIVEDREERICTKEMVGSIIQSGYSFPRYEEIAG